MREVIFSLLMLFAISSCVPTNKSSETNEGGIKVEQGIQDLSMFPKAEEGYKQIVIHLDNLNDEEQKRSVEFVVGKLEELDCNNYSLTGQFEEKDVPGYGYTYYIYPKDYDMIGTARGCIDGKKVEKYVRSESVVTWYNSRSPIVIYVPEELSVKYTLWSKQDSEWHSSEGGDHNLSMYPKAKPGYKQKILTLDGMGDEEHNLKLELIAGKKMMVDCNNHHLTASWKQVFIEGWGYDYHEFPDNFEHISTRKGCPDQTQKEAFVTGDGTKVRYNSRLPIVTYIPEELELKVYLWKRSNTWTQLS